MKLAFTGTAALLLSAAPMLAGGIERAPQSLSALFEAGNYAELSFGGVNPSVSGTDALGAGTGDVAQGYGYVGLAYKQQFTPNISGAFIIEQPFGANIAYSTAAEGGSSLLGGTSARVDSTTFTALGRYRFENNFSVHGGIRGSRANAELTLDGLAYSAVAGYNVQLDTSWGAGWVAGAAYEVPEIAARVSLTYNSPIEHDFDTREIIAPGAVTTTSVKTPRSWTLEGQTGIAADTLLIGSIRWVKWSEFHVEPAAFTAATGRGLVSLEDTTTYTIGVGRKFSDAWSGVASFTYESGGNDLVSPLAPTSGRKGVTLAAIYTMDSLKVTTGINYTKLGDAQPQTAGTPRAQMSGSDAWGVGVRVGYSF